MSEPKTVLLRREGGVLHLTLNRPELRNALSIAMVAELRAALAAAEADASVRVIVLRGAGGHFCAGGDLKDMAAARMRLADEGPRVLAEMNAAFGHLCGAFAASKLAIVVVLEGVVMGGGLGLACVADVVLAGETASLRLPETSLGVVPAQIAPFLVERLGYSQARRLAVTGGKLDARQALALGLVHELHVGADLDAALQRVLSEILRCAPGALAATKALMARARLHAPASLVDEAAEAFTKAALGPEGMEGVSAFLEQRKPAWAPL
ncbi:enoyl-CoA hydratase/isomerase family protein [Paucibacter sp. KCTC 42545]|uniref:enoyl-CoA hydratase/isomerase family protein n=1 Tax=Paucibacter sp. KCTC 42545 TaxID=1768242 RepID=UPI000733BE16|nr:enoyl-CoA hydratase-related protein [Paucibacter sp. KCTC 42545]ALT78196.1 enoyl-CoA hydratase [Paucibacter sp. KCTC 42545]